MFFKISLIILSLEDKKSDKFLDDLRILMRNTDTICKLQVINRNPPLCRRSKFALVKKIYCYSGFLKKSSDLHNNNNSRWHKKNLKTFFQGRCANWKKTRATRIASPLSKYRLFFLRSIAQFFTQIYTNCFVSS